MTIENQLGKSRFVDIVKLEPKNENLKAEGILGNFKVVGTTYIVTKEAYVKDLQCEISEQIKVSRAGARYRAALQFFQLGKE